MHVFRGRERERERGNERKLRGRTECKGQEKRVSSEKIAESLYGREISY